MVDPSETQISHPQSPGQSPMHPESSGKAKNPTSTRENTYTETLPGDASLTSKTSRRRSRGKKQRKTEQKQGKGLTPYQGPFRAFGVFYCELCKKQWYSANSWADSYQKCNECRGKVYPYRQFKLEMGTGPKEGRPPHPQDKCQKCMELGFPCFQLYVDKTRKNRNDSFIREE